MIRKLLVVTMLIVPFAVQAEMPQIGEARIDLPPPGAPVAAGYFILVNPDDAALVITGASSARADKVEIHLTTIVDEVARMAHQEQLVVDPGATLTLEHGSYHLMFTGLSTPFEAGEEIAVTLDTSAGPIDIVLPVGSGIAGKDHSTMKQNDTNHEEMNSENMQHD